MMGTFRNILATVFVTRRLRSRIGALQKLRTLAAETSRWAAPSMQRVPRPNPHPSQFSPQQGQIVRRERSGTSIELVGYDVTTFKPRARSLTEERPQPPSSAGKTNKQDSGKPKDSSNVFWTVRADKTQTYLSPCGGNICWVLCKLQPHMPKSSPLLNNGHLLTFQSRQSSWAVQQADLYKKTSPGR